MSKPKVTLEVTESEALLIMSALGSRENHYADRGLNYTARAVSYGKLRDKVAEAYRHTTTPGLLMGIDLETGRVF